MFKQVRNRKITIFQPIFKKQNLIQARPFMHGKATGENSQGTGNSLSSCINPQSTD